MLRVSVCSFKREIFDPNFIRLPEMNNIRDLIERSRRGLKFTGKSKLEITRFIRSSVNDVGVRRGNESFNTS